MNESASLDAAFSALADPTRRAILARLASGGDATVLALAQPFAISLPAISKHLKVLERAGLVSRGRDAQRRPCHFNIRPLTEASQWIDHTRAVWEARFDRLESYLRDIQSPTHQAKDKDDGR